MAAIVAVLAVWAFRNWQAGESKLIVGANDEIYYSRRVSQEDAAALGRALQSIGFFNNRGTSVLLSRGSDGAVVSFVLSDGAWLRPGAPANFEEIGRRVAPSVGGYPIQVHLVDSSRDIKREMTVGKALVGERDAVYYLGSATMAEARALGRALQGERYFGDIGATVVLSKGDGNAVSFVVQEGVWDKPDAVAGFEALTRRIAPTAGGLPLTLRLLNSEMETRKELAVQP